MSSRYRFQASAVGAAGRLTVPFQEQIEVQASCALPEIGGYGSAISSAFNYRQFLSFDVAHSEVTGSETGKEGNRVYSTLVNSTVEGLNVMGMVTADRVVAHIAKTYDPNKDSNHQQSFKLIGTRFENLKIAGKPVEVDLALDANDQCNTYEEVLAAYSIENRVDRGIASVALGKVVTKACKFEGNETYIDGFGTIQLAELQIGPSTRRVNMLRIDLGSPVVGSMVVVSIIVDGSNY